MIKSLYGMIHLPALPGYPDCPGMAALIDHAMGEAEVYQELGFRGVLIENENDRPHRLLATPEVISSMTTITKCVVDAFRQLDVGAEVLLNDPKASLAIALGSGAQFIRTDYFVDRMAREEYGGEMHIDPKGWVEYRNSIGASSVRIFADLQVKYATLLKDKTMEQSAKQACAHHADAVIVTGRITGEPPSADDLLGAGKGAESAAVFIGSGLNPENAPAILPLCDGAIVGTGIMKGGFVDRQKAKRLIDIAECL